MTTVKLLSAISFSTLALLATTAQASAQDLPTIPEDTEIVTTESGLKYSVLQKGDGTQSPKFGDRVRVHYSGWLTNGTMFDSSRMRGEPSEFGVGRVVEGWNEALQLMSPGSKWKLTIPAALGYADVARPQIPANSTLIFEVELLAITDTTIPFVPWTDEGVTKDEGTGVAHRVLAAGSGIACDAADIVDLEFALYDAEGKPLFSSSMDGPLVGNPMQMPLEFLGDIMPLVKAGSKLILKVPTTRMTRLASVPGIVEGQSYVWQVHVSGSYTFEKPDFVLPLDAELTTTESGLKYQVLRTGKGKRPSATSTVLAHYAGWLTDGTPFDNSYDRGEPSRFPLNGVIKGWTEGLQLMQSGGKVLFVIPGDLAYGDRGRPPSIPGDATLVFVVELVNVQ